MMQFQKMVALDRDPSVIEKYFSKKFAREAEWEDMKDRLVRVMEFFHINYKSYAEEYEEFVTLKMKQQQQQQQQSRMNHSCNTVPGDFYSILGVDRCASEEEIKRNFRVKVMKIHPDFSE